MDNTSSKELTVPDTRLIARTATALALAVLGACHVPSPVVLQYEKETVLTISGGFECDPLGLEAIGALVTPTRQTLCSGTLISSDTVLTAAHCIEGEDPTKLFFALGPEMKQAVAIPISSWLEHPRYTGSKRGAYDLALLHLRGPAPSVTPLPFRKRPLPAYFRGRLTFVGYGNNDGVAKTGSGIKRCLRMPVSLVDDTTVMNQTRGHNACHGDSGGPVLDYKDGKWEIAGVISSGDSLCERIGLSSRVDVASEWIEQALRAQATDPTHSP